MRAKHTTTCPLCLQPINRGTEIAQHPVDGTIKWCHWACIPTENTTGWNGTPSERTSDWRRKQKRNANA